MMEIMVISEALKWQRVREIRDDLLARVDYIKTSDTLTDAEREDGLIYIQALKDVPQNFANPDDVVFPAPPEYIRTRLKL